MKALESRIVSAILIVMVALATAVFVSGGARAQEPALPQAVAPEAAGESGADKEAVVPPEPAEPKTESETPAGPPESGEKQDSSQDKSAEGGDDKKTAAETPEEVTVRKTGEGEWRVINRQGVFSGILRREPDNPTTYRLFSASGQYNGRILEGGLWLPKDAASKYTQIFENEVILYLDALDAIEKIKSTGE